MSTNKLTFSELFYHKSSALRVELNTFKDQARFKIEVIPALKDTAGVPVLSASGKPKFDYKASLSMLFSTVELLRIKKIIENILNPAKTVPADGYNLEHYFEVASTTTPGTKEKKKSVATFKRLENNYKPKSPSPFEYKFVVGLSLYSSAKGTSAAIVLTEDESYWFMNMLPLLVLEFVRENGRIGNDAKPAAAGASPAAGSAVSGGTAGPSPQASTPTPVATPATNEPSEPDFKDIPFDDDIPF